MDLFTALKEFDFEKMLPDIGAYVGGLKIWAWVFLMAAPVALLVMGIRYSKIPAFDPNNCRVFFRKLIGEDRELWDTAHRLTGRSWTTLGGILMGVGALCGVIFFFVDALAAAIIAVLLIIVELVLVLVSQGSIKGKLRKM